jgi:hypothetical protein
MRTAALQLASTSPPRYHAECERRVAPEHLLVIIDPPF